MSEDKLKRCYGCKSYKRRTEFYISKTRSDGLQGRCKECAYSYNKKWHGENKERELNRRKNYYKNNRFRILERGEAIRLKNKYGLTPDELEQLRKEQQFKCKICNEVPAKLFIDHNHFTGKVRGLLCNHCNSVLGYAKERTEVLEAAIKYLKEHDA